MSKRPDRKTESEVIEIDEYVPNWQRKCDACDACPVVEGLRRGKQIRLVNLCGPCTFGTSYAIDPGEWNRLG